MDYAKLASEIVQYVDEESRDFDPDDFGVPSRQSSYTRAVTARTAIEAGVVEKLKRAVVAAPVAAPQRIAASTAQVLIAAGVLTQQQWDAAEAFVATISKEVA